MQSKFLYMSVSTRVTVHIHVTQNDDAHKVEKLYKRWTSTPQYYNHTMHTSLAMCMLQYSNNEALPFHL